MNRVVVVGGFTEGEMALEPVAEAACEFGIAEDADIFKFRDVMYDDTDLVRASRGQHVITHSAGVLALSNQVSPRRISSYNGPEQSSKIDLVKAAARKTLNHQKAVITGPYRVRHIRTLASNTAELAIHPIGNLRHLGKIAGFSTIERLSVFRAFQGTHADVVIMEQDEFFSTSDKLHNQAHTLGISVVRLDGFHDDLLVEPRRILEATFQEQ